MESRVLDIDFGKVVHVPEKTRGRTVCVVCEHASNRIPVGLSNLGLADEAQWSHVAWDPGAEPVAKALAKHLSAAEVYGGVSRLVYDCNRPPHAASAMPAQSEKYVIPGNLKLSQAARQQRIDAVYQPFRDAVSGTIDAHRSSLELIVTIHSFNPVFNGAPRSCEIGILHGKDDRFAQAMLATIPDDFPYRADLNQPYSAADGVAHTLDLHGAENGLLNVMIEVRNDLIVSSRQQQDMASLLAGWIQSTQDRLRVAQ